MEYSGVQGTLSTSYLLDRQPSGNEKLCIDDNLPFRLDSSSMESETEHMLTAMKTAMRILGYKNRHFERQLELSSSYMTRLFSGQIELKFRHIVDLAQVMGLETGEFLRFAYPNLPPPTEAALRLRSLIGIPEAAGSQPAAPPPAPKGPTPREMEEMVVTAMRKLFGEMAREKS
jgi:hypothetical protein